jgi:PKD repeat protein
MGYTVFSVKPVTVKGKKYGTGRNFAAGNFIQFKNKADAETAISKGAVVRCPFDPNKITMDLNAPLTVLIGQVVEIQPGNKHKGDSTPPVIPTYTINVTEGADTLSFNFTTTPAGTGTYAFGDGSSSNLGNGTASHSYAEAGTYTVTFTPAEGDAVSVDVEAVAVTPPEEPPAE